MKCASLFATALLLWSSAAFGGDQNQTLEDFSSDLVELYSLSGITKSQLADMNPKAQVYAFHRLMKQANKFQAKWRDSDLVEIDRLHISGGDQLALEIEFRFK